jgi:hypothetical protein
MALASSSSAMRSRGCRDRPTAGLRDTTSLRLGFGGCMPEAIKAARPPGLSTAKDFCATSPPTAFIGLSIRLGHGSPPTLALDFFSETSGQAPHVNRPGMPARYYSPLVSLLALKRIQVTMPSTRAIGATIATAPETRRLRSYHQKQSANAAISQSRTRGIRIANVPTRGSAARLGDLPWPITPSFPHTSRSMRYCP